MSRRALTLLELLVCLSILAIFFGLLLPAMQRVRQAASRLHCANNLKQWGVAVHHHESALGRLPSAGDPWHQPCRPELGGAGWMWQAYPYAERNEGIVTCPAKPGPRRFPRWGCSDFAVMTDYAGADLDQPGAFAVGRVGLPLHALSGGSSNTLLAAEKRLNLAQAAVGRTFDDDFGIAAGFDHDVMRSTLLPPLPDFRGSVAPEYSPEIGAPRFGGSHGLVFNGLYADGSVRPLNYDLSPDLWRVMGRR